MAGHGIEADVPHARQCQQGCDPLPGEQVEVFGIVIFTGRHRHENRPAREFHAMARGEFDFGDVFPHLESGDEVVGREQPLVGGDVSLDHGEIGQTSGANLGELGGASPRSFQRGHGKGGEGIEQGPEKGAAPAAEIEQRIRTEPAQPPKNLGHPRQLHGALEAMEPQPGGKPGGDDPGVVLRRQAIQLGVDPLGSQGEGDAAGANGAPDRSGGQADEVEVLDLGKSHGENGMMHPLFSRIEHGSVPRVRDWIELLGGDFQVLERMDDTPQEPEWHGEGNVRVHTDLVLGEIERMLRPGGAGAHLTGNRRLGLVLGGLMHDLGKVFTTQERVIGDRVRIVSPNHPARGRSWWALHHHPLQLPEEVMEAVMALIGHHHDPRRIAVADASPAVYRKLARHCDLELAYLLELADLGGRQAANQKSELELLEWFRTQAMEYGVWRNPEPWKDWQEHLQQALASESPAVCRLALAEGIRQAEEGQIFTPEEAVAKSYVWRKRGRGPGELVVLCGLSGAGKSRWIESNLPGHVVVSLDAWRERIGGRRGIRNREGEVFQAAREQLREHLREGRPVAWDATSLRRAQRSQIVQLGLDYHAWVQIVCVSTPLEEIRRRQTKRPQGPPWAALEKQIERCEWPFAAQAHALCTVSGK